MHTYIKRDDENDYVIGEWALGLQGFDIFQHLFTVATVADAFMAVHYLNGGSSQNIGSDFLAKRIVKEF